MSKRPVLANARRTQAMVNAAEYDREGGKAGVEQLRCSVTARDDRPEDGYGSKALCVHFVKIHADGSGDWASHARASRQSFFLRGTGTPKTVMVIAKARKRNNMGRVHGWSSAYMDSKTAAGTEMGNGHRG